MVRPPPKPTSPYNFGLGSDFQIALIQPFLYFYSAIFLQVSAAIFPDNPTEVAYACPNTCGLTQPDDLLACLDQRRYLLGEQAAISLTSIGIICLASVYYDFKWHVSDEASHYRSPLWIPVWMKFRVDDSFLRNKLFKCVTTDLPQLLDLIAQQSSSGSRVKWIVSSRNWPQIEERLEKAADKVNVSLELNVESVAAAVNAFILHKVDDLAGLKKYDPRTKKTVQDYLCSNAQDTFLWVALVCQCDKGCVQGLEQ